MNLDWPTDTPTSPHTTWTSLRHSDDSMWHRPLDLNGYTALMSRDFTKAGTCWRVTIHHRSLVVMTFTKWGKADAVHALTEAIIKDLRA